MYDRDVPEVNAKLDGCAGTLICSNPSIELWFLLHFCNQKTSLNTTACIKALPEGKNPSSSVYKFLEAVEKSIT